MPKMKKSSKCLSRITHRESYVLLIKIKNLNIKVLDKLFQKLAGSRDGVLVALRRERKS